MSCCTILKMHNVYSVCFVITDVRSLTITYIIYTHVLQMSCMWIKDGFQFKFISGQLSGLPTELPAISILESSGVLTELPTVSIYGSSGQPNLHGKIPMGSPLRCPLSCPLFSYLEAVGCLLSCPLGTVSIYGSSGQPNLHGKISMGCPRAAHSVAHVQPMGSEVGSSPVFSVWEIRRCISFFFFCICDVTKSFVFVCRANKVNVEEWLVFRNDFHLCILESAWSA